MKKIAIAIIILLMAVIVLFILAGAYTDRLIDPYVRSLLETQKPLNHKIEYENIKVNLFRRLIKIRDVKVMPEDSLNRDEKIWMEISVSTIRLTDFNVGKLIFSKALNIGDFDLLKPEVIVHLPLHPAIEIIDSISADRETKTKKQILESIALDRVLISEGSFKLIRNNTILVSSPDINFTSAMIRVITNEKSEPIGYSYGKISLSLKTIAVHSGSGLYTMRLDSFSANKEDSTITLKGFRMIPRFDKKEFSEQLEFQDDRFDITINEMQVQGIGIEQLITENTLKVAAVWINGLDADIYRDKNVAFDMNKFPLFHNEMFLKLNVPLYLDSLLITNSRIQYGELVADREEPGTIILEEFDLRSYNLTNQTEEDIIFNEMRLFVNAKVMGEGNLNAELALPLEGNLRKISCSGSVGAMELSPLNSMLEPSISIKFKTGKLNRMTFSFTGNNDKSSGWMEFLYNDLDVELLRKNTEKQWGFISMLANSVTLSNNPAPGKDLKTVEIGYERDKNKGLINYIWKTIQSGMVRTIVPSNKHQINKKEAEKVKKKPEETKIKPVKKNKDKTRK